MHFSQPTPELPVPNVRVAQEYYRDTFGFEIAWLEDDGRIGAVGSEHCTIFFRQAEEPVPPSTFWLFVSDVDKAYSDLEGQGARIADPISDKPWGLRQFTIEDHCGHRFHFFHDL